MAGSITVRDRCLVKDGMAYTGTKSDIVNQLGSIRFDKGRTLIFKARFCKEVSYHSYGDSFNDQEMYDDAVNFIFDRLSGRKYIQI